MADRTVSIDLIGRDRASAAFASASRGAAKTESSFKRAGRTFASAGKLAGRAGVAVGALGVAGGLFGLKIAASNEQAQISFTTMLGSAKKAGKFLGELQAFAAKTPFEFPELQKAASSLISAGFQAKQVIPIMTTLGDVTSGMGTGSEGIKRATVALQQMSAAGKITGEDLNQLRDAGVPVFDLLANATGKSKAKIAELAAAGKLSKKDMNDLFKALETGGGGLKRFTGLMDKQSQSLTGLWSTFKDTLGQGLAKAIQPMIPTIKVALAKASALIGEMLAGIPAAIAKVRGFADPIVAKIREALPVIKSAFQSWSGAAMTAITALSLGIKTGDWSGLGSALGDGVGKALSGGAGIGTKLVTAFAGIDWLSLGKRVGAAALPFAVGLSTGILSEIIPFIAHHPWAVVELAAALIPIGKLAKVIGPLAEKIGLPLIPGMLRGVAKSGGAVEKAFSAIFRGVVRGIERVLPGPVLAIRGMLHDISFVIKSYGDTLVGRGRTLMRGLAQGVSHGVDNVVVGVRLVISRMLSPFKAAGTWLVKAGINMVQGLIAGIGTLAGAAKTAAENMVKGAIKGAWDLIKPGSPSKVFTWLGETVPAGFAKGIKAGSKKAVAAMKDMVDSVKTKLGDLKSQARDIASAASDAVKGVLDVSAIGAAVETTVAGVTTPGRSIIDPLTGAVTTTADVTSADVTTSRTPSAASTLAGFAGQATAFAAALAAMAKKGLAPALIAAVAAAGPAGGLTAAQALASESKADDATVNAAMASIGKSGLAAGNLVLSTTRIPADIKREEKQLAAAERIEKLLKDGLVAEVKIKGDDLYVVLKRAEKNAARKK